MNWKIFLFIFLLIKPLQLLATIDVEDSPEGCSSVKLGKPDELPKGDTDRIYKILPKLGEELFQATCLLAEFLALSSKILYRGASKKYWELEEAAAKRLVHAFRKYSPMAKNAVYRSYEKCFSIYIRPKVETFEQPTEDPFSGA